MMVLLPDKVILRQGNDVLAVTVDGYVCYGTKKPLTMNCYRAIEPPQIEMRKMNAF